MTRDLLHFFQRHDQILVLTGAGVSTASGIPDYRDKYGNWKNSQPIYYQDFIRTKVCRQRYWSRSVVGWQHFNSALPGKAHMALAQLEEKDKLIHIITQNVDRLHQRAGNQQVIDLHGTLDQVICLDCRTLMLRSQIQNFLLEENPQLRTISSEMAPDGDAKLTSFDFNAIKIPCCEKCGGIVKPNVVFYGENVPRVKVQNCFDQVENADALLVVGSSLMVYSGFRFVRRAHEKEIPIAAINQGVTRADGLLNLKINEDCGDALSQVIQAL